MNLQARILRVQEFRANGILSSFIAMNFDETENLTL